jgi:hypothetical protein
MTEARKVFSSSSEWGGSSGEEEIGEGEEGGWDEKAARLLTGRRGGRELISGGGIGGVEGVLR